ncbi:MAG: hypothetical protein HUU47_00220 [Bacteroidetes bacterium]|nr:hypothetical protein [Bacteroidota bacterium]
MFRILLTILLLECFTSCVSKKKYNELVLEKNKAQNKNLKLEQKLESLLNYQQKLIDSLDKIQ